MFRSSMRSSSVSTLLISLLMLLILKTIKIFKKHYQSIVVMWQRVFSTYYRHTKHTLPHNHDGLIILFKYFNSFLYQQHQQGNK